MNELLAKIKKPEENKTMDELLAKKFLKMLYELAGEQLGVDIVIENIRKREDPINKEIEQNTKTKEKNYRGKKVATI